MAFERIKNFASSTKEKISSAAETIKDIKDTGTEMAEDAFKKVAGVTKEWKSDLIDSIKLKTVDKWNMNLGRGKENWLLKRKEGNIEKTQGKIDKVETKISEKEADKNAEKENFNKKAEEISDPVLKEVFQKAIGNKEQEFNKKIKVLEGKKTVFEERKNKFEGQKSKYQENIKAIEEKMTGRINGKIDGIKEKYGLKDKLEKKGVIDENFNKSKDELDGLEKKLGEYKKVMEMKKLLTREDRKKIREMTKAVEKEFKQKKSELKRINKGRGKLDRQIEKINKRTQKWEDLKVKYGLVKKEQTATDSSTTTSAETTAEASVETEASVESEKEKIKKLLQDTENLCKVGNVEELKANIPAVQKNLKKIGADQKGSPLELAYKFLPKPNAEDKKIKEDMNYVKQTLERFREVL